MKNFIALPALLLLTACAGIENANYYSQTAPTREIISGEKCFLVNDNVRYRRAVVMECAGVDGFKSIVEGLSLGLLDLTAAAVKFENVIINMKRANGDTCEVTDSQFIADGVGGGVGYEIFYECDAATPFPLLNQHDT